jgi:hypothetical protein
MYIRLESHARSPEPLGLHLRKVLGKLRDGAALPTGRSRMATQKQIDANRLNAEKSTGPKTAEGKARSSRNALKHGLLAEGALLPGESRSDYQAFAEALIEELDPHGPLEERLVERIADCAWRLRRPLRVEVAMLTHRKPLSLAYYHAQGSISVMSRYENSLQRNMINALHELERLQARRKRTKICETNPNEPAIASRSCIRSRSCHARGVLGTQHSARGRRPS